MKKNIICSIELGVKTTVWPFGVSSQSLINQVKKVFTVLTGDPDLDYQRETVFVFHSENEEI